MDEQVQQDVDNLLKQCANLFVLAPEPPQQTKDVARTKGHVTNRSKVVKTGSSKLGRYKILHKIGQGGAGQVYKAYDPYLERVVALKMLFPEMAQDQVSVERLKREAKCNGQLRHSNIVSLFDFILIGKRYVLVMQYVNGFSLAQYLQRKSLSINESCKMILDMLDAMGYAHQKGIIHRDLKPSNILLDRDHNLFITDFGLAKMRQQQSTISQAGAIIGTPTYMSPEQARGNGNVDLRSDLYSLGVIFYEMLTGQVPFGEQNLLPLLYKIVHEKPPHLQSINARIPDSLADICLKSLAKEKHERYHSAQQMADDIRACMRQKRTIASTVVAKKTRPLRKQAILLVTFCSLLLICWGLYSPKSYAYPTRIVAKEVKKSKKIDSQAQVFPESFWRRILKEQNRQKRHGRSFFRKGFGHMHQGHRRFLWRMDKNKDKQITRDEWKLNKRAFTKMDLDQNNILSTDEIERVKRRIRRNKRGD